MKTMVNKAVDTREEHEEQQAQLIQGPSIQVIGTGGAGNNTINRLARIGIEGAELIAVNTDKQHLGVVHDSVKKILIGQSVTNGLGSGGVPKVGAKAAEVSRGTLGEAMDGVDMVFLTAGQGGGTGTGTAPIIADIAKEQGAIVIAMVTYPFKLEKERLKKADEGIRKLKRVADTVIIIDNNRLVELVPNLPMREAFHVADEVIARAVKGITETITTPSLINLDYADIRAIMKEAGVSVISVGEAKSHNRTEEVVEDTLKNSLLDIDYAGARGALIHITGGPDLTLGEANSIGEQLTEAIDPNATVIWGARVAPEYEGRVEVISIMTGVRSPNIRGPMGDIMDEESSAPRMEKELGIEYLK